MKRLKYCLIALAVIVALIVIVIKVNGLHFSKENALHNIESKLHYGPSDEVLYEQLNKDGSEFILAKCGDEGLSIVHLANHLGFLYGLGGDGEIGYKACDNQISIFYDEDNDRIYGMCYDPEIKQVSVDLRIGGEDDIKSFLADVDENGFFVKENAGEDLGLLRNDSANDGDYREGVYACALDENGFDLSVDSNMPKGLVSIREVVPDPTYPVDWSFLMEAPEGELSVDLVNQFNRIILPRNTIEGEEYINTNMMYNFIMPSGGASKDLKLQDVLWDYPEYIEMTSELYEALGRTDKWSKYEKEWTKSLEVFSDMNPHGGLAAHDGKTVREALKYYTDLDIDDIDCRDTIYSAEPDLYFSLTHYADGGFFWAEHGFKEGEKVTFWYDNWWGDCDYALVLLERDGRYIIDGYYDAEAAGLDPSDEQ